MKNAPIIFLVIILLGLGLRLWRINIPLLEFQPSRQVQTAEITKNLFLDHFNILQPTVTYLGPGKVPFIIEFPGYNFIVSLIYFANGSVNEIFGRLFSILGWIMGVFLLFKIAEELLDKRAALIAVLFYTLSPISVLVSRSFQPDQWMLTFSLGSIYCFIKFKTSKRVGLFVLSAFLASISALLKIPSLIFTVFPIVLFILFLRESRKILYSTIYLSTSVALPAIWYIYAFILNKHGLTTQGAFSFFNYFNPYLFLKYKYYATVFGDEYTLVILPIGIILFTVGLFIKYKGLQRFVYFWLLGVISYFLIFNNPVMVHEYYHLPFLPIASIFIAVGFMTVVETFKKMRRLVIAFLSLLIILNCFPYILSRAYKPIDRFKMVPLVGEKVQQLTNKGDLIIGSMDSGPSLVYYSKRNGWGFDSKGKGNPSVNGEYFSPQNYLEYLKSKGAVVFASAYKKQFLANRDFSTYMYMKYKTLVDNDDYVIFDLKSEKN